MILFADGTTTSTTTTTITPSGGWADPVAWGNFYEKVGPGTFFFVFCVLVGSFFAWRWGSTIVNCLFGDSGVLQKFWDRLDKFLAKVEENQAVLTDTMKTHLGNCNQIHSAGGPCNVTDIREAGHAAAEALRKIGRNEACENEAERIHQALRGGPMMPPTVQGQQ